MTDAMLTLNDLRIPLSTGGKSRRAKLTIDRDGSLRLWAAADVERDELGAFLAAKRDWIYRKLAEKEELLFDPIRKELVNGEGFNYLGRSYRLRVTDTDDAEVFVDRGWLVLPTSRRVNGNQAIVEWYRRRGLQWLRPRASDLAARLRVELRRLDVRSSVTSGVSRRLIEA